MSTRIVLVDYVVPMQTKDGDICTGCPRLDRPNGECRHFGTLVLKPRTNSTYRRHANCIRAEERTKHSSISQIMYRNDFIPEDHANFDKEER